MDELHLSDNQGTAMDLLNGDMLDPKILLEYCPLDYGRQPWLIPKASLGALETLLTELCCQVLRAVDVQSLLVFRRVNEKVMATIKEMPEFKKTMSCAPNAVRMAIGARTVHTFTIQQLYVKLCQVTYDLGCGKPAPYLDVFKLRRTCLWIGGSCDNFPGPKDIVDVLLMFTGPGEDDYDSDEGDDEELHVARSLQVSALLSASALPSFVLPSLRRHLRSTRQDHLRTTYYDVGEASEALARNGYAKPQSFIFEGLDESCKISAVFAPWTNDRSLDAIHGEFCAQCLEMEEMQSSDIWHMNGILDIDLARVAFGSSEWLARPVKERHDDGLKKVVRKDWPCKI
ncbi:hypothetical protein EK21DRAFT_91046 [Setomelanomma holmii]|uniref:F-box domain-containing protein n=1 Tax=Setomelanomma holmii TaxID=210430 RepID=A0A9P4H5K8_9PLEO|nr:hypothetical protein EK21DRAFT_91046 [Setomelanomma holmii]